MKRIELYVLNQFTKQDRYIFGIGDLGIGRPIRVKSVVYFLVFAGILGILRFLPITNLLLKHLPLIWYALLPGFFTWLLTEYHTENRTPIQYLKARILYGIRQFQGKSYYRGKALERKKNYKFYSLIDGGYLTYKEKDQGGKDIDS